MDYTPDEKEVLELMNRTDFKNLSKVDAMTIASKFDDMDPEVAKAIIAQYPEFSRVLQSALTEFSKSIGGVISSDDASVSQVYGLANSDAQESSKSRSEFYNLVNKVQDDLSKTLDRPDLTKEERAEVLSREMKLVEMAGDKDDKIRNHEERTLDLVDKKDSEKRTFNWALAGAVCAGILTLAGIGVAAYLGGETKKLPDGEVDS